MVAIFKIKVNAARNLPVMDTISGLTDGYVELKFGPKFHFKTNVVKKTLNPTWNQDYRLEVSESSYIQDYVIELKVWDKDLVGTDDIIGTVFVDPMILVHENGASSMEGWIPLYDTLKGIRGELNISIKCHVLSNISKYKDSSAEVQIFSTSLPVTMQPTSNEIQGMVEDLLVDEDPEHDWLDLVRSSRTTNAQRQYTMFTLSGRVRRQIGRKVTEGGGNAVIGYRELFDLEDGGIIVRGLGTQCRLNPIVTEDATQNSSSFEEAKSNASELKVGSLPTSISMLGASPPRPLFGSPPSNFPLSDAVLFSNKLNRLDDIHLCTITSWGGENIVSHLGGMVSARSVKVIIDKKKAELSQERDSWWNEIREEIRGHARTLKCTHVLGYSEQTVIHKDVCILLASGTAAVLKNHANVALKKKKPPCKLCHIPYTVQNTPFAIQHTLCKLCKKKYVPELLLCTADIPPNIPACGKAKLIEARICKIMSKKKMTTEGYAKFVSEILPFIEYELHRQLLLKMNMYCLNSCFGLKYNVTCSDTKFVATLTGTALFCTALPLPSPLEFQRSLQVVSQEDQFMYNLQNHLKLVNEENRKGIMSLLKENSTESSDLDEPEEQSIANFGQSSSSFDSTGFLGEELEDVKSAFVVEIDDDTDEDNMAALLDNALPPGLAFSNLQSTEFIPGHPPMLCNLQNIFVQKRYVLNANPEHINQHLSTLFNDLYNTITDKLKLFTPCAICGVNSDIKLVNETEILISWNAMALLFKNEPVDNTDADDHSLPGNLPITSGESTSGGISDLIAAEKQTSLLTESMMKTAISEQKEEQLLQVEPQSSFLQQEQSSSPPQTQAGSSAVLSSAISSYVNELKQSRLSSKNSQNKPDTARSSEFPSETEELLFQMEGNESAFTASNAYDDDDESSSSDDDYTPTPSRKGSISAPLTLSSTTDWIQKTYVAMTPLSFIPGTNTKRIIGRISQHFVRETDDYGSEGYGSFVTKMLLEANAVVRAHIYALGGNALLNHDVAFHVSLDNPYKRQAYSLITISGDVADIAYSNSHSYEGITLLSLLNSTYHSNIQH